MVYSMQMYPAAKYHWTKDCVLVNNADEEAALGGGWADTPAAFAAYRGPRQARTAELNAIRWIDDWPVAGVTSDHRQLIKIELLRADAEFWKSPDTPRAPLTTMRQAMGCAALGISRLRGQSWRDKAGVLTGRQLLHHGDTELNQAPGPLGERGAGIFVSLPGRLRFPHTLSHGHVPNVDILEPHIPLASRMQLERNESIERLRRGVGEIDDRDAVQNRHHMVVLHL